jgi:hypothetical protein
MSEVGGMARYLQVLNAGDCSVPVPRGRCCADRMYRPTTACSERQFAPPLMHSDAANHDFTFPTFGITPGQTCRVSSNENHPEYCGFNYGSGSAI